jgi:hypothetical protein
MLLLLGCTSNTTFKDDDIVAIVYGDKITYKDVRSLHKFESSNARKYIEGYVIQELVIHEAKSMGIKVEDIDIEDEKQLFPPSAMIEQNKEFFESQAKYLEMTTEEYYEYFLIESKVKQQYMDQYIDKKFGEPSPEEVDNFSKKVNDHLNNLLIKHEDNIQILVK